MLSYFLFRYLKHNHIFPSYFFTLYFTKYRKPVNHHSYTRLFHEFAYAIYTSSWSAIKILSSLLLFPAESSLRTNFSPIIKTIEDRLTNISEIEDTLLKRQNIQNANDFEIITCTLTIDAFSISHLKKEKINNCYYI